VVLGFGFLWLLLLKKIGAPKTVKKKKKKKKKKKRGPNPP